MDSDVSSGIKLALVGLTMRPNDANDPDDSTSDLFFAGKLALQVLTDNICEEASFVTSHMVTSVTPELTEHMYSPPQLSVILRLVALFSWSHMYSLK